ncbi:MAG: UDP-glucose 4-epimerase [Cellvibrionaceae bacterium]|jgi:UDP-glucose 4-epimerase
MKTLIIGGAGFIGSHIAEELVGQNRPVRILDNFRTGNRKNLAGLDVEIIEGDIADFKIVYDAMAGCDLVFHQAALVSVPESIQKPELNHQINVTGAYHVFEAARQHGIKRVVYASSAAVYGDEPDLPCKLSAKPKPISPYAAAKYMNELYASTYNQAYGTEFIGLRYFNVYGPRQDPTSPYSGFLSICCNFIVNQKELTIFGDGGQTRDFVYVKDVVQANLLASEVEYKSDRAVFNVATGRSVTLNQVLDSFNSIAKDGIQVRYGEARAGDILHSTADISRTVEQLGFDPKQSLEDGLAQTLSWYQESS